MLEENSTLKQAKEALEERVKELNEEVASARETADKPKSTNKNPLADLTFDAIVDLILELPKSKRDAVIHDLVKETGKKPAEAKAADPPKAEKRKVSKPKKSQRSKK